MRTFLKAAAIVAMIAVPTAGFAQAKKSTATHEKTSTKVATHTTAGVVKSSTDSSLVITKGGKDETFVVNSSTQKQGTVDTGSHVSVHYTMDGKTMVATAISVQPAKPAKTPKGKQ
jgi:predicted nucleic acid binding AN1-type Zn finger protein